MKRRSRSGNVSWYHVGRPWLHCPARSVASIRSILKNGLDRAFLDEDGRSDREPIRHHNIRGRGYFH